MITENGKDILGKYLIGSAPAYASYIAVGCGATPVDEAHVFDQTELASMRSKTALDFEMFRMPITSRGFIEENGETRLVFSAEVPTIDRYEITEIGLFSASSNPAAAGYDSRTIYAFTREEPWKFGEQLLPVIDTPLDNGDPSNNIYSVYVADNPVIQINATNRLFANLLRQNRAEQSRYYNNMIMLAGNLSDLSDGSATAGEWLTANQQNISLATSLDLSKNSPQDKLKLALSVIDVDGDAGVAPNRVRVVLEFTTSDNSGTFKMQFESTAGDLTASRYQVLEQSIYQGITSGVFSWSKVNNINAYAATIDENGDVIVDGNGNPTYYVALDAIRLENVTSISPLYGLTGYTIVKNSENGVARPIIKLPNSAAMIEFRLGIGIYNG